ncbi:serine/threonine-protein kinase [Nocardioides thalensis]|uniref:non-specific serine/threonine protein kinase n=1 Tax=Nocardioides thalensis TaxID=1914755 RepID=A0A853C7H9_9ACTN|nr:serine/threonine-protein kinase [Nocardioides thalensis]
MPPNPPSGPGPAPGSLRPGDRVGPYLLVRQIGKGGMGIVFEAVDGVLDRRVALKIISPHLAGDPGFRARFTREAQAQASLDSPHVVTVFAHGEVAGALYIASQLIPDGDLGQMVRRQGAPPPGIALDLIAQIADGLADAHAMGLVHRDIKPANVLLRIRGEKVSAYLADFGIARRVDSTGMTTDGTAVGTPSYMAPELHTGGTAGPASDVYSLGCLLWAALCGQAPYVGTSDYQIVTAHVSQPVPQIVETGTFEREVNRILRTAMAKSPGDRYASAGSLRDDLRSVLRTSAPSSARVLPQSGSGTAMRPAVDQSPAPPSSPAPPTATGYSAAHQPTAGAHHFFTPSPAPPARRRTGLIVGAVAAVVLVIGGGAAAALVLDDDGGEGGGGGRTTAPVTESTDADGLTPDERTAVQNIAEGLAAEGDVEAAEAECVARGLVREHGLDGLIDAGLINEDLEIVETTSTEIDPGIWTDIISIGVSCILDPTPTE